MIEQFPARPFGRLLVVAFFICGIVSVSAQGTLNFANSTGTRLTVQTGANFPAAGTTSFKAGLYWGAQGTPEASLTLLPAASNGVTTIWGPFSGMFSGGTATFPVPGGTIISVQVRVWSAAYADYSAALNGLLINPYEVLGKGIVQTLTLGNAGDPSHRPARSGHSQWRRNAIPRVFDWGSDYSGTVEHCSRVARSRCGCPVLSPQVSVVFS